MDKYYVVSLDLYETEKEINPCPAVIYVAGDRRTYPLEIRLLAHCKPYRVPLGSMAALTFISKGFADFTDIGDVGGERGIVRYDIKHNIGLEACSNESRNVRNNNKSR